MTQTRREQFLAVLEHEGGLCISEGTLRAYDIVFPMLDVLEILDSKAHAKLCAEIPASARDNSGCQWWDSEACSWFVNEDLFGALNDHAPDGFYFGSHPNDGACFGFWRCDEED